MVATYNFGSVYILLNIFLLYVIWYLISKLFYVLNL